MPFEIRSLELPTGVSLQYTEQGDPANTTVLLLPGLGDSWHSYETVLTHLPESIHAIALTQRGHGDSSRPQQGYRINDFAADAIAFLDAYPLESAVIVGHSLGSSVAQRIAIDHIERTLGLVLIGPFYGQPSEQAAQGAWEQVADFEDRIDRDVLRAFQENMIAKSVPPAWFETIVNESHKVPARVWKAILASTFDQDNFDGELPRIAAPTLIVWGDQDDVSTQQDVEALLAAIPNAQLKVYHGTAHSPQWEEPARFANDLVTFTETHVA